MPLKSDQIKIAYAERCNACPLQATWPSLKHPRISASGPQSAAVYVVGEAPGAMEDTEGSPFVGQSGEILRNALKEAKIEDYRINNTIRCRPPHNAKPTWHSIEACRSFLEEDLELVKPKVIVAVGTIALKWFVSQGSILLWSGKPFPLRLGNHCFWVVPVIHPAYLLRNQQSGVYAEFLRSLHMVKTVLDTFPDALFHVHTVKSLEQPKTIMSLSQLRNEVPLWMNLPKIIIDLETTGLDPLTGKILTVALTDPQYNTIVFPIGHKESDCENAKVKLDILEKILLSAGKICAQNATFELRWLLTHLPTRRIQQSDWHDTMLMSYILDCRPGGAGSGGLHSLDNMALLVLGIENFKKSSDIDVTNLANEPIEKVLEYNGLDAVVTARIAHILGRKLIQANLFKTYMMHKARIPSLSALMLEGLPIDKEKTQDLLEAQLRNEREILDKLSKDELVRQFCEVEHALFNPASTMQVKKLMVGCGMIPPDSSTDEEAISGISHPFPQNILELRKTHKLVAFYQDFITKIHPMDGKIHANFNHTFTVTGRLSSSNPNLQNLKKGAPRGIITAPPGKILIGADYGQLEACVIAAVSQDDYFINAIRNGMDIHADCARDLAKLDKRCARLAEKDFKKFRNTIKNLWVFPAFYQASVPSLAEFMGISMKKAQQYYDQFWLRFRGVRQWQHRLTDEYARTGYIMGPTGRRYGNIMGPNDIANYPIQGAASDIVVEAGNRCVEKELIPCCNVHDELMFCVNEEEVSSQLALMKELLLAKPNPVYFGWLTVPLSITIKKGYNWYEMTDMEKCATTWTSVKN